MLKGKKPNVSSNKKSENVKVKRNSKKTSSKNPKSVADKRARKIAVDRKSELTIHGRDGRIQDKERYEVDPYPKGDKKH